MTPAQRTQVRIAVVALIVFAGAMTWMLTHRRSAKALSAPRFLQLVAKEGASGRPIAPGATVKADELIDFQIEVFELCFVYVFKVESGTVSLMWGHLASDEAWDIGVYAPDWKDGLGGLKVMMPGQVKLFAVSSPTPLVGLDSWTSGDVEDPSSKCPRCGVGSVTLTAEPGRPIPNRP